MFGIFDNKNCVADRMAIESGVKVQILLGETCYLFFSLIRLVSNPISDCKKNEDAKDAYKSYEGQCITSSGGLKT